MCRLSEFLEICVNPHSLLRNEMELLDQMIQFSHDLLKSIEVWSILKSELLSRLILVSVALAKS